MTDDMAERIAKLLREMGYVNVEDNAGVVYYEEVDGTKHFLLEHDV